MVNCQKVAVVCEGVMGWQQLVWRCYGCKARQGKVRARQSDQIVCCLPLRCPDIQTYDAVAGQKLLSTVNHHNFACDVNPPPPILSHPHAPIRDLQSFAKTRTLVLAIKNSFSDLLRLFYYTGFCAQSNDRYMSSVIYKLIALESFGPRHD